MNARAEIFGYLTARGIPHRVVRHAPVHCMEDCKRLVSVPTGAYMPKNILLSTRNKSAFVLLLTRPELPYRTADISKKLSSSRLSFADEGALNTLLKTEGGAISPLGLIFDDERRVRLAADRALLSHSLLAFHPNARDLSVLLTARDFFDLFLPSLGIEPVMIDA